MECQHQVFEKMRWSLNLHKRSFKRKAWCRPFIRENLIKSELTRGEIKLARGVRVPLLIGSIKFGLSIENPVRLCCTRCARTYGLFWCSCMMLFRWFVRSFIGLHACLLAWMHVWENSPSGTNLVLSTKIIILAAHHSVIFKMAFGPFD